MSTEKINIVVDEDDSVFRPYLDNRFKLFSNIVREPDEEYFVISKDFRDRLDVMPYYIIDQCRTDKISNYMYMNKCNIPTPTSIFSSAKRYLALMRSKQEYIAKPILGARGVGHVLVTRETISDAIDRSLSNKNENDSINNICRKQDDDCITIDTKDIKQAKLEPTGQFTDKYEELYYKTTLTDNPLFLVEKIEFKEEYRLLLFKGCEDYLLEKRTGYEIYSKEKREHSVVDKKVLSSKIVDKIRWFFNTMPYASASFDVYIDYHGNWGLFEFSQEYGTDYSGYEDKLVSLTSDSILNVIDSKNRGFI